MLSVMPEGNALFWPANAVTLAALLRFNGARLPAIGLVVLAAEVAADIPRFSLVEALLFGMINFAEAAGAFLLLRRVRFDAAIHRGIGRVEIPARRPRRVGMRRLAGRGGVQRLPRRAKPPTSSSSASGGSATPSG